MAMRFEEVIEGSHLQLKLSPRCVSQLRISVYSIGNPLYLPSLKLSNRTGVLSSFTCHITEYSSLHACIDHEDILCSDN